MEKFVAIACKGKEFIYRRDSAHAVPVSSAEKIRSALNAAGYRLRPGETWHLYDNEGLYCWKKFYIRSGRIWEGTV